MAKRKGKPSNPYRDERVQAVNIWALKLMLSNVRKHKVNEIRMRVLTVFNTERKNLGAFVGSHDFRVRFDFEDLLSELHLFFLFVLNFFSREIFFLVMVSFGSNFSQFLSLHTLDLSHQGENASLPSQLTAIKR